MAIQTINPTTGEVIKTYQEMSESEINDAIEKSYAAFLLWSKQDFSSRAKLMHKAADLLRNNKIVYARLITQEMGKPIKDAQSEIEKCALVCDYFAEHAQEFLKKRLIKTELSRSYVTYQPLGIVFAIMPWNFPFWQVFRFAAPTLMAGNCALLKHAPISTGTALAIEKLFIEAGFPEHVFKTLVISNEQAEKVIAHSRISAVTLTGSPRAGSIVGANAAKALKKVVLELGGSDPYIILEDADLDDAAEACVRSRLNNAGQVCIAAKRLIVVESVIDKFKKLIIDKVQRYIMADPMLEDTNLGPLAREDIRKEVHNQVCDSIKKGAELITGGVIPERAGYYYPPTILAQVTKGMPAYDQEIFGPVIAIISAKDEQDALVKANDSHYGLGAAVFTKDLARGEKIAAEEINAGSCAVNTFVASDPRLPFGGIKNSGYGRELSEEGIQSFTNVKTVLIK